MGSADNIMIPQGGLSKKYEELGGKMSVQMKAAWKSEASKCHYLKKKKWMRQALHKNINISKDYGTGFHRQKR